MNQADKIVGIDLGTTNSVLAVIEGGIPVLLPVGGDRLLPSVVGIAPNGEVVVGTPARNQWVVAPERTVRSIKRQMGKGETVGMAGKSYTPQEISAFILNAIREAAQAVLGAGARRAVITVPAYFNETQRQATLEAGEIAGLIVERIINEPTASALAYGYGLAGDQQLKVLVYDLGGGTFDVSIIELHSGVVDVLATAGDNYLGGDDFDERLAARLADEFAAEHHIDLREHHQAWARLLRAAEEAKIELSAAPYAEIKLEYITQDRKGRPLHIEREVARSEFEELIADLLGRTIALVRRALIDAHLKPDDIERVLVYVKAPASLLPAEQGKVQLNDRLRALRDRAFLLTLADTGLRVHEACKLRRGDMDWNEGRAIIIGKGDKQAVVRFSTRSIKALKDYLSLRAQLDGGSGKQLTALPLFARHDKGAGKKIKPITTTTGRNIVAERVKQILGEDATGKITPHSFRHYFVTTVLRGSGGNLKLAQELARHRNITVTQRYAHLSDDDLDHGYDDIFN